VWQVSSLALRLRARELQLVDASANDGSLASATCVGDKAESQSRLQLLLYVGDVYTGILVRQVAASHWKGSTGGLASTPFPMVPGARRSELTDDLMRHVPLG